MTVASVDVTTTVELAREHGVYEASRLTGVSATTIYRWCRAAGIPNVRTLSDQRRNAMVESVRTIGIGPTARAFDVSRGTVERLCRRAGVASALPGGGQKRAKTRRVRRTVKTISTFPSVTPVPALAVPATVVARADEVAFCPPHYWDCNDQRRHVCRKCAATKDVVPTYLNAGRMRWTYGEDESG